MHLAINLAERAFDFGMPGMTDEHQHATPGNVSPALVVHFGDQRASGVDGRQRPQPRVVFNFSRDAMGAEDGDGSRRHVLQSLDEARAFRLERFDHVAVVNDLMAHVDRRAMLGQRPLDNIDRPNNASAKPARLSQYDLHPLAFSSKPRRASQPSTPSSADPREPRDEFRNGPIRRNVCRDKTGPQPCAFDTMC